MQYHLTDYYFQNKKTSTTDIIEVLSAGEGTRTPTP